MGAKDVMKRAARWILKEFKEEKLYPIPQPVNAQSILDGKVALITGGSSGIGLAMARSFLNSGCKVILAGRNEDKLKRCVAELGTNAYSIVLDVRDIPLMSDKIRQAASLPDENRIDILVNSAGVVPHKSFEDMTEQEYDTVMDINAKGTYFMCQAMGKYMIENNIKGHILNVSSSSSLRPGWTPYQISKWAVRGMTLGVADKLLPHGIIVNAIAPGPVATPMLGKKEGDSIGLWKQPSGRYAVTSEIAALATFMVSDLGNLIVGDTVYMTGGSGNLSYQF